MSNQFDGKKILIFGGSGFIGKYLISRLSKYTCSIEIITRKNNKHKELKFLGGLGQVNIKTCYNFSEEIINRLIMNADIVFNLIGILFEKKTASFNKIHSEIPRMIAKSCKSNDVKKLIHLSALGVNKNFQSKYAISKYAGERNIIKEFPNAVIIRPSVVFGDEDNFVNLFSKMSNFSPIMPIIGTPKITFEKKFFPNINFKSGVNFQPVYVGDLADFIISSSFEEKKVYDLAGPGIISFRMIIELILKLRKRKRICLPMPLFMARLAAFFLEKLPYPLLTVDQVILLKSDNISKEGFQNLKKKVDFPKSMEIILPTYIK